MRKPVFGVVDQVGQKQDCTAIEYGWRLEILDLGTRDCSIFIAKTKALISWAVTAS